MLMLAGNWKPKPSVTRLVFPARMRSEQARWDSNQRCRSCSWSHTPHQLSLAGLRLGTAQSSGRARWCNWPDECPTGRASNIGRADFLKTWRGSLDHWHPSPGATSAALHWSWTFLLHRVSSGAGSLPLRSFRVRCCDGMQCSKCYCFAQVANASV